MLKRGELSDDEFRAAQAQVFSGRKPTIPDQNRPRREMERSDPSRREADNPGPPHFKSAYGAAVAVSGLLSTLGWLQVIVGVVAFVVGLGSSGVNFVGALAIGAVLSIGGLLQIAAAQVIRAAVDTADYSREILSILHSRLK